MMQRKLGRAVSRTRSAPAPVGGLNVKDALANMPVTDAVVMDNWFPQPSYVGVRNGYKNYVTGITGWVESLLAYSNAAGRKLFGIAGGKVYDVTTSGVVGASVVSGLANSRWEYVNFSTPAGNFLYACNATDKPLLYNGTTWTAIDGASAPAITGVTTTKLRNPCVWKNKLWFVEDGSFNAWYLPTQSIGGAAQSLNLGSVFRLGGVLASIFTVSIDNASSIDDYIAFLSTEGEIALYRGTDPAQAGLFGLVGLFRAGRPIGRRHIFRYASDTVLLTADGFSPVSKLLMSNRDQLQQNLSYKILNAVGEDVAIYANNFGWQGILYPIGNKIIINVPVNENYEQRQYVMNTVTGAWSRFTGWNACCFELLDDRIFFGGNGVVAQCDVGGNDNGANITTQLEPAYSYFGTQQQKHFNMVRPVFSANGDISPAIALAVDFNEARPNTAVTSTAGTLGAAWDIATWDVDGWVTANTVTRNWLSVTGTGFAGTLYLTTATKDVDLKLQAIDYNFEVGGIL